MRFVAESIIRATPERVFAFHDLPDALSRLTPAFAGVRVLAGAPGVAMGARSVVELRVAPLVWIRGEYVHTVCEPPHLFVDQQVRGPWRSWRHRHVFEAHPEGTRLVDDIEFEPPLGVLGRVLAPILIVPRLRRIFDWRHEATRAWCEPPTNLC